MKEEKKGSLAVHDTPKEYYGRVAQTNKEIENLVVKGLLGTDWKKTAENAINALKSIKTTEKRTNTSLTELKTCRLQAGGRKRHAEAKKREPRERYREKEKYIKTLNNFITKSLKDPFYFRNRKRTQSQSARRAAAEKLAEELKKSSSNSRGKGRGI